MADDRIDLTGSERSAPAGARAVGAVDPAAEIEVTVVVRRRQGAQPHTGAALSREEFAAARGADPADLDAVTAFAAAHSLRVVSSDAARRAVVLGGTASALSAAFSVSLDEYTDVDGARFRGRTGPLQVPTALEPLIDAVLGLDDRPQSRAHFRLLGSAAAPTPTSDPRAASPPEGAATGAPTSAAGAAPAPTATPAPPSPALATSPPASAPAPGPHAAARPFLPTEVAALYDFPAGLDGSGQCIGIVELGGGYRDQDVSAYFSSLGIPTPTVVAIGVDGGANSPTGDPSSADGEVVLDIDVAGAVAPAARIAVYFAPNSDRGFVDAVTTAVHDTRNRPSVISISWGQAEQGWTRQALLALDAAFQDAAAMGVSVCVASGDDGSSDRVGDGRAHTDFPASSPNALACGGTRLTAAGPSTIADEVVWNDPGGGSTGGGVSDIFPLPDYQRSAHIPPSANPGGHVGRGVPDVSGDADPVTGYRVHIDGVDTVVGGTSAVAPLWAGLIARLNQGLGRPLGRLQPALYGGAATTLRDVTQGSNGAYSAGPGWDACTGLGSPRGSALLAALRQTAGP